MIRFLAVVFMALAVLGACGKKGPLSPPPGYGQQQPADAD